MRPWLLSLDVVAVLVFVVVGRSSHNQSETLPAILETAAPFLLGLGLGWLIMRAWRDPVDLRIGIGVVAVTVAAGMVLRRFVFDDGTEMTFILVATAFLALFMLGWRVAVIRFQARSPVG